MLLRYNYGQIWTDGYIVRGEDAEEEIGRDQLKLERWSREKDQQHRESVKKVSTKGHRVNPAS